MSPDKLQQYMCRQYIQRQVWDLEEEKRIIKGNKTKIGKEIAKLKKKIEEIDQDLKGKNEHSKK